MKKKIKRIKNYKSYLIHSERTSHLFGAFEHTEEGLAAAEKYVKKLTRQHKEAFVIRSV